MPRRDGTGPIGQGAMTGRQMGNCNPNADQPLDDTGTRNSGMGMAWGRGGGVGRGLAQRRGIGRSSRGQGRSAK